eukprot:TRINITY_DN3227_c0_g2_i1.p1 TRINITY_DN3227_c0_g2~~TRINITY_DN3227_c0_g2_i1.p1  ORF type:complete len:571 (+),score=218.48 TRINITY_DN3227_c0_g2_i1:53-1765(+)
MAEAEAAATSPAHVDPAAADVPLGEDGKPLTKSALKKLEKERAKAAKKAEAAAKKAAESAITFDPEKFGPLPLIESKPQSGTVWTDVDKVVEGLEGQEVVIRARIAAARKASAKLGFVVLRQNLGTIQCVMSEGTGCSRDMIKYVCGLPTESIIDVHGKVVKPNEPVHACTQSDVEIQITKVFCVSSSQPVLPFQVVDAAGQTEGIEVSQDTRLDARWLDMRTPANQAIWRLRSKICQYWREYLTGEDFCEIQTPKIIPMASEGGASIFKLEYFDKPAFLAQSPQLYKQMALMGDLKKVFECGPVFRAENSNTHRHLCEFVGLDVELEIKEHYYEVLDVAEALFTYIFDELHGKCQKLIDTVYKQWANTPFVHKLSLETITGLKLGNIDEKKESEDEYGAYIRNNDVRSLRMTYPNAMRLLNTALPKEEQIEVDADMGTTQEKILGKLVKERYGVDFYILDWFPLSVRPFYTMPNPNDARFSNSYDMFMRGEEISSGAQRIHDPELLMKRCKEMEVDAAPLQDYMNSFKLGAWPHGGFGVGLDRVVMLFLGMHNVRSCSLFPRTPIRNTP